MGVYINGMEMPNKKNGAVLIIYPNGECAFEDGQMYQAIPVPPHGKLGDLDALYAHMCKAHDKWRENPAQYMSINPFTDDETMVLYAPTIIPAEPCNNLSKPFKEEDET